MQTTAIRHDEDAAPVLLRGWKPELTASIGAFIGRIDSFYLGTADANGQPYIQHRGGPPGFLRVIDRRTLAFADFSGNRQYVSVGHLAANPKAFLFLMDYERRQRVKIFGTARATHDAAMLRATRVEGYDAEIERVIVFSVRGWTANCPQHIPRRYSDATMDAQTASLRARVAELEAENARLRQKPPTSLKSCPNGRRLANRIFAIDPKSTEQALRSSRGKWWERPDEVPIDHG